MAASLGCGVLLQQYALMSGLPVTTDLHASPGGFSVHIMLHSSSARVVGACRFSLAAGLGCGVRLCSDYFEVAGQLWRLEVYPGGMHISLPGI